MSLPILTVVWNDKPFTGAMDVLPLEWFSKRGSFIEREHVVKGPGGRSVGRYKAKCNVIVRDLSADLDYEAFPAFNRRHDNVLGVMRVQFADKRRRQPIQVLWKAKGGTVFRPFSTTLGFESLKFLENSKDVDLLQAAPEGRRFLTTHLRRERNVKLVAAKKAAVLAQGRRLICEACRFSFEDVYGSLGKDYCEVHHRQQLSLAKAGVRELSDLAILCSNCHRMIHRTRPMLSVEKFALMYLTARSTAKRRKWRTRVSGG